MIDIATHRARSATLGISARVLKYLLLALAAVMLLSTLALATAPAGALARLAPRLHPDLYLHTPSGRLFAGQAHILFAGRALGRLRWTLVASELLAAKLSLNLDLAAPGHDASARVTFAADGSISVARARALIRERSLDDLLRGYDIQPSGVLEVQSGQGQGTANGIVAAQAQARWSGGAVRYRLGGTDYSARLPSLSAELRVQEGHPVLDVRDPANAPLLDVALRPDGWAELRVRYRLVQLVGYPWADPPAADEVVVEISEKLL